MGQKEADLTRRITDTIFQGITERQGKPPSSPHTVNPDQYLFNQVLDARSSVPELTVENIARELSNRLSGETRQARNLRNFGLTKRDIHAMELLLSPADPFFTTLYETLSYEVLGITHVSQSGDITKLADTADRRNKCYALACAANELIMNCWDKDHNGKIYVNISKSSGDNTYSLSVTDILPYPPEQIPKLLASLNSDGVTTNMEYKNPAGSNRKYAGMGIRMARNILTSFGGNLIFEENNGIVVAHAIWIQEKYDKPDITDNKW
jgi:hypothetical protein